MDKQVWVVQKRYGFIDHTETDIRCVCATLELAMAEVKSSINLVYKAGDLEWDYCESSSHGRVMWWVNPNSPFSYESIEISEIELVDGK